MSGSEPTIRDRVRAIQVAMRDQTQTPEQAEQFLWELTGLFSTVTEVETAADVEYRVILADCYDKEGKGNRAKIRAEAHPAYKTWVEAKSVRVRVDKMIGTCKACLRSHEAQARNIGR